VRSVNSAGPFDLAQDRPSAADRARALVESAQPPALPRTAAERRAVAWALKDLCYAAWSSEPQRAVKAAQALRTLADAVRTEGTAADDVAALADWTTGIAAVTQGQLAEAEAAFGRAHDAFSSLGHPDHAAATQVPLIMALSLQGRYEDAIACAHRAQRQFIALDDRSAAAKVSLNLGSMYVHRGDYVQAARHSREAAVLFARVKDHEHSVMADINLAYALTYRGDFDEALRVFARSSMRAATHAFPVLQAIVEEAVAELQLARGRYAEALAGFEGARRRYQHLEMTQEHAVAERQLADAYLELHLLPEALALLEQVISHSRAVGRADEQARALAQRGRALALLGKDATASFEQAARLYAAQGNAAGEASVMLARAELALAAGNAGRALEMATGAGHGFAAVGQLEGRLRADMIRAHALLQAGSVEQARALFEATRAQAHTLELRSVQVRCLTGLGMAAHAGGDVPTARAAFTGAVALFEEQRRALPDATIRSAFLTDHLRPYHELLRLAVDEHARVGSVTTAAHVLRHLDRCRARALSERVAQGAERAESFDAQALRVNWLYRTVERRQGEGEDVAALADEARRDERALLELSRRGRLTTGGLGETAHEDDFDIIELQQRLGAGDALVEYGVLDDELFACVVDREGVSVHRRLARWSEVLESLRSARFQIESLRNGAAPLEQHMQQLIERARARLRRLYALVWQPIAPALAGRARVLVVPHGQLGSAPFAALEDAQGCLAERHLLALAPSARMALRGLRRQPMGPTQALVLGESTRLPHAAQEARTVADLLAATTTAIGKEATIARLKAAAGGAGVIHLACHAQFRSDNPTFSALHLHDGPLTVDVVETLGLGPATVVLSGCETGLADAGSGDEMVGLVRAFLIAGASRVLASLWPVDDAVTAQFMTNFYEALRAASPSDAGPSPASALAQAQRAVRDRHPHPLHWAAFTLYGGW
jgi:CHAT domain-containing protein